MTLKEEESITSTAEIPIKVLHSYLHIRPASHLDHRRFHLGASDRGKRGKPFPRSGDGDRGTERKRNSAEFLWLTAHSVDGIQQKSLSVPNSAELVSNVTRKSRQSAAEMAKTTA